MALPKKRKLSVPIKRIDPQGGPANWVDQFLDKNKQFLPRTVDHGDLDKGFIDFVNNELGIVVKGDQIPVHAFSLQRWNEFAKTWQNSDKYGNIKIPFVSVVRKPDAQVGTNPADFKIPVRKNFPYMRIPVWNGNRKGMDIHMIPNPVGVDLTYTVRFFSYRQRELNKFNQRVLQEFASAQAYINVKGHYFPILLESIGDESQVTDINSKRYYVQTYEMKLQGYLVDSEEFETKPAITRAFITETTTNFKTVETENISTYEILKNGSPVTLPFTVTENDAIIINIVKTDSNQISEIILRGLVPI